MQTLLQAAKAPWVTVVFTLRADFYGRVLEDEAFGRRVEAGLVNVLPMSREGEGSPSSARLASIST